MSGHPLYLSVDPARDSYLMHLDYPCAPGRPRVTTHNESLLASLVKMETSIQIQFNELQMVGMMFV